jgi:hypothetical protein
MHRAAVQGDGFAQVLHDPQGDPLRVADPVVGVQQDREGIRAQMRDRGLGRSKRAQQSGDCNE